MVGYLFAGQGSQYIGMGKDLYEAFPESKAVFDRAEQVLGFDFLKRRCFQGPQEMLKITSISQPAILAMSIACLEAFKSSASSSKFPAPSFMAGLSLGEYTALVAAGSLTLEDGLRLVRKRSEIMDEAARKKPGKMLAVLDLTFEQVKNICLHSGAEIANINAPGQIVISGRPEAVDKATDMCLESGTKRVIELEVSGGFHSSLMSDASVELKAVLENTLLSEPTVPVISNYTAHPEYRISQIKENLVYQMYSSVKWEESMRFMLSQGINQFYEFGPGKVLKGLMRRINPDARVTSIEKKEDIENAS